MNEQSRRSRPGIVLGAGVLLIAGALWLLTREPGASGPADDASVLTRERTPGESAAPELPATAAAGATPESLAAALPVTPAGDTSAAASGPALPGEEALFTGRVVDERGTPIAGATVSHVPTRTLRRPLGLVRGRSSLDLAWDGLPAAVTAGDGRFSLPSREVARDPDAPPDPDVDEYLAGVLGGGVPGLVASHPDHEVRVHACKGFRSGAYDAGDIVLPAGEAVIGRLVTRDGVAVGGADVGLAPNHITDMAARSGDAGVAARLLHVGSGPDGRFRLGRLGPGLAVLEVHHGDFVPWGTSLTIAAGVLLDLGDIELAPARHIRGVVLDAQGRPVPDASLLARGSAQRMDMLFGGADPLSQEIGSSTGFDTGGRHEVRVRADATGAFDLGTLDQAWYDVFAQASGHDPACLRDVQAGTDGVVLALEGQATLLLSVVDAAARAPLADVTAQAWRRSETKGLFSASRGAQLQVLAGAAAAAAAGQAGDGLELVLVQRAGAEGTDVVLSAPGRATTGFVLPGVPPGQRLARTLELAREAVLEGRVQDTAGEPVAEASLTLRWPEEAGVRLPERQATSDADGRFRFDRLLPGAWTLSASAEGFLDRWSVPQPVADSAVPQQALITLDRGASLRGLVVDADGMPSPEVDVEVTLLEGAWSGRRFRETCSSEGRFTFDVLPPGAARVGAWPGAEAQVTLVTGQEAVITLALRRLPVVRGRVTRAGQPVAQAKVVGRSASPRGGGASPQSVRVMYDGMRRGFGGGDPSATTSATGEYSLELAAPGTWVLQAQAGAAQGSAVAVTTDWDRVDVVDLAFGSERLAGVVIDARTRQPVASATVTLHDRARDADPAFAGFARAAELDRNDTTDEQGRFAFEQLQPGAWVASVQAAGYADAAHETLLAAGGGRSGEDAGPIELVLALEPGIRLEGTLRMASGKPLYPDLRIGLDSSGHPAPGDAMFISTQAANVAWTWPGSPPPGPCTVMVWRDIATQLGKFDPADVLVAVPVVLVAGETRSVDLVIDG